MVSQKQLEQKAAKEKKLEERRRNKKLKAFTEIIREILVSKRTFFKTKEQLEGTLKRKMQKKIRELKITEGFSPEETKFIQEIALIAERDEKISNELCHLTRNRSISLGVFSRRINRLSKGMLRKLNIISKIDEPLREIEKDAKIIYKEAKLAEKTLGNKVNKNNKKKEG